MPRGWKALPVPGREKLLLKAPTYQVFLDQEFDGDHFRAPRVLALEMDQALAMLHGLTQDPRVAPARATEDHMSLTYSLVFRVYRYNRGLAVEMPSGWTLYFQVFEHEQAATTEAKPKGTTRGGKKPRKDDELAASGGTRAVAH